MATEPKLLFVVIPEVPEDASFKFHPISRSQNPKRYKVDELRDTGEAKTAWLTFFEEILVGLYWKYDGPVLFVFRTADGTVRSLDAGCVKWLLNRTPPEVILHCDQTGVIEAVTPSPVLLSRYESDREALVGRLSSKPAADRA
jgi:hypothetical protein